MVVGTVPDALARSLSEHDGRAIAGCGGVDSVSLAHAAHAVRRGAPDVYHAVSPAVPTEAAAELWRKVGDDGLRKAAYRGG